MTEKIYTGKTLKDALNKASQTLGIDVKDLSYSVLAAGKGGFLGFLGAKDAVIKVHVDDEELTKKEESKLAPTTTKKVEERVEKSKSSQEEIESVEEDKKPKQVEIIEKQPMEGSPYEDTIRQFLDPILLSMVNHYNLNIRQEEDRLYVTILNTHREKFGILIGKRGITLDAMQYLLSIVINQETEEYLKVILDTENYRGKREKALVDLAERMANKAVQENRRKRLNPMNPFERRIIHMALQGNDQVTTYSEGKEPYRRVVIEVERK